MPFFYRLSYTLESIRKGEDKYLANSNHVALELNICISYPSSALDNAGASATKEFKVPPRYNSRELGFT